ncbi:MAG: isopenicillin N synthase family oxygenase [Gammaproteobacteria bacterium]|nr:isopenicillin N synthase family oxygenase [Gammaproteobacteria bacterium]
MELTIISYFDLLESHRFAKDQLKAALFDSGIVGISHVPHFEEKSQQYIRTVRQFCALDEKVKQQYKPNRDAGLTEGYELGAEWFKDSDGHWKIDDKKASFYAFVPDQPRNKWPKEIDLKTPYLELGKLMFNVGKNILNLIQLNKTFGIDLDGLEGYGRMLHYHKVHKNEKANWCGAHFDHGIFTGLMPAYYFKNGHEIEEPDSAGLYIKPPTSTTFEKVRVNKKSIILFQVGEFGQLASHDEIRATEHLVLQAQEGIERFTFALFSNPAANTTIYPKSELIKDSRYKNHCLEDGGIQYSAWAKASYARYRAS